MPRPEPALIMPKHPELELKPRESHSWTAIFSLFQPPSAPFSPGAFLLVVVQLCNVQLPPLSAMWTTVEPVRQ